MCCVITYYLRFWALGNNAQNRDDDPQSEGSGVLGVGTCRETRNVRGRASGYRCLVVSWSRGPAAPESVWVGKNLPAKREDDPQSEGSGEVLLGGARGDPQSVGERRSFLGGAVREDDPQCEGRPAK